MKRYFSFSIISRIAASALLFWALSKHQYGYFILLRWIVCGVSIYCSYLALSMKNIPWTWTFGLVGLLFNPLAPIHLDRSTWAYLDIASGLLLLTSIFFIKESHPRKGEQNV